MRIEPLYLKGAALIHSHPVKDERGFFERLFCHQELRPLLGHKSICQINLSESRLRGCVRGLHYQVEPHREVKIVRCIRGKIFDVMVDIRRHSPTFLQHFSRVLDGQDSTMIFIPEGFAHGFQVLQPDSQILYCVTAAYQPTAERGLNALDPKLAIPWPLDITEQSVKDLNYPSIESSFVGI